VKDVRPELTAQRSRLLELLESFDDDSDWGRATPAAAWSVTDISPRLLTNADDDPNAIELSGDEALGRSLLLVRGVIA
jgi:hypothetical protein